MKLVFLPLALVAPAPIGAQTLINGAGATFRYPFYAHWFDTYARVDSTVRFNYQIFAYASSPFEDWHRQAWASALVLIALVWALDVVARVVTRRRRESDGAVADGIVVKDLNAWFGAQHVVKQVSMEVPRNAVTAVIGPSGCGKSTCIRCLNRMHETVRGPG